MYINCAATVYMYVAVTSGTRLVASTSGNVCRLHEVLPDCLIHRGGEEEEVLQNRNKVLVYALIIQYCRSGNFRH